MEEIIKDLARKYANMCEFKSDFAHDWNSVNDGFTEGFKTALRLIESGAIAVQSNENGALPIPDVIKSVCAFDNMCKIKNKDGKCRKNCKHYQVKQTVL